MSDRRSTITRRGVLALGGAAALSAGLGLVSPTGASATTTHPGSPRHLPHVREHVAAFQRIADGAHGHRHVGSPGCTRSIDYVERVLEQQGFRVERESFPVQEDVIFRQVVRRTSPDPQPVEGFAIVGTRDTPAGGSTAALIAAKDGWGTAPDSWDGLEPTGKIGLVDLDRDDEDRLRIQLREADRLGMVGLLLRDPALYSTDAPRLTAAGDALLPPSYRISPADGDDLRAQLRQGPVTIFMDVATQADFSTTGTNLLARTPGDAPRRFISGAHIDSAFEGPGINDNAAAAAVLLSTAVLAGRRGPSPVQFCWWDAEELGVLGSSHHVARLRDRGELGEVEAVLNMELVGSPNPTLWVTGSSAHDYYGRYLRSNQRPFRVEETKWAGSDSGPFLYEGIPAVTITCPAGPVPADEASWYGAVADELGDPNYHTPFDTADKLRWDMVDLIGWATDAAHREMAASGRGR